MPCRTDTDPPTWTGRLLVKFQETDLKFKETSRLVGDLGGRWGLFVDNHVAPACERLFAERGIPVQMVSQRVKKRLGGEILEIDVLVVNAGHYRRSLFVLAQTGDSVRILNDARFQPRVR